MDQTHRAMEDVVGDDGLGPVLRVAKVHELQRAPVRGNSASSFVRRGVWREFATDLDEDLSVRAQRCGAAAVERRTRREERG
jgi:hypothetical protein